MMRQLDSLAKIMDHTSTAEQRELLLEQAAMIARLAEQSVQEPADRAAVQREYEVVLTAAARMAAGAATEPAARIAASDERASADD
jgi:hypothetical protein